MEIDDGPVVLTGTAQGARFSAVWNLIARQIETHWTMVKFALMGGLGYLIYTGLLLFVYDLSLLPFLPDKDTSVRLLFFTHGDALLLITTLVGTEASIIGVFSGHSLWTFADRPTARKPLWLRFLQFQAKALISTLGILTVAVNGLAVGAGLHPYAAVPIGLVTAFTWNWLWDSKFIWPRRSLPR